METRREGDHCFTIGQVRPSTAYTIYLFVTGYTHDEYMAGVSMQITYDRVEPRNGVRVLLVRKVCVPANSVSLCPSRLDKESADCMMIPSIEMLTPHILHSYLPRQWEYLLDLPG